MDKAKNFNVGLFIDGYTFKKVNEYYRYHHSRQSCIDFRGFKNWVTHTVRQFFKVEKGLHLEAHYYHPYENPDQNAPIQHIGTYRFENKLIEAGIQMHYNNVPSKQKPNLDLIDDAIMFSMYKKIDVAVLVSTQGQFAKLPCQLKRLGVPMVLLGWNFEYPGNQYVVKWHTDFVLKEKSFHYIAMDKVMEKENDAQESAITTQMFQRNKIDLKVKALASAETVFWKEMSMSPEHQ
ncbi:MAG TPA: NYN domain-containing protein [Fibrobacter sp.]|nr:NYN domain-containing protein [Fibrobacter sp.]